MTIQEIEKKSLALNALDKIHLIEKLLSSLDKPDPEIEKVWIKEAEERFAAYEKGEIKAVPLEKVLKNIKRKWMYTFPLFLNRKTIVYEDYQIF